MNITDLIIIIFIILGAVVGFKQGFTRSLVECVGYIAVIIIAFLLKDIVGEFLMLHLPFFDFFGLIKGLSILNIAVYQTIAFLLIFGILMLILKTLMIATTIFETILKFTIILGIPSKILGAILGIIKNYTIVFTVLYVLSLPIFSDLKILNNSKTYNPIMEKTPILSIFAEKTMTITNEFSSIKEKYSQSETNEFNLETLDLFLKYDIVKPQTIDKLIEKDKIHIKNIEPVLNKYRKE